MAAKGVNLDALIPREDLAIGEGLQSGDTGDLTMSHAHFANKFFRSLLRKPEFQRETTQWSPEKIVDLVAAFLDRRLIPAVIVWKAGNYCFVIDGAHRLSALLAWMDDDYGDGKKSKELFGKEIDPEQQALATKTRDLIENKIGKYELFEASLTFPKVVTDQQKERIGNLGSVSNFVAQWVPAATKEAAEDSFHIINANATPLEKTEKKILLSRGAANSIAARAISHAGAGYPYWKEFEDEAKEKIVGLGKDIYNLLYRPPMDQGPIDTLDVTVAGRGYSVLPFVFDLVNFANRTTKAALPADKDGSETLKYLGRTFQAVSRITGKSPTSLGLHPVVYFYTKGATYMPWSFLAWSDIIDGLFSKGKVNEFHDVRPALETFLVDHKWAMTEIVHTNGSGARSIGPLTKFWTFVLDLYLSGATENEVTAAWRESDAFAYVLRKDPILRVPSEGSKKRLSNATITATYWDASLPGAPRCCVCNARLHRNSQTGEHLTAIRDGGDARPSNAGISHPYCNSTYKDWKAKKAQLS